MKRISQSRPGPRPAGSRRADCPGTSRSVYEPFRNSVIGTSLGRVTVSRGLPVRRNHFDDLATSYQVRRVPLASFSSKAAFSSRTPAQDDLSGPQRLARQQALLALLGRLLLPPGMAWRGRKPSCRIAASPNPPHAYSAGLIGVRLDEDDALPAVIHDGVDGDFDHVGRRRQGRRSPRRTGRPGSCRRGCRCSP